MKIPIGFSLWLIYKAVKAEPDPLDEGDGWNWDGRPEPGNPLPSLGKNPWPTPKGEQSKERAKEHALVH